jgi:hypothetical protein
MMGRKKTFFSKKKEQRSKSKEARAKKQEQRSKKKVSSINFELRIIEEVNFFICFYFYQLFYKERSEEY